MKTRAMWGGLIAAGMLVGMQLLAAGTYPTAVMPFHERGKDVDGYGEKVGDVVFATLAGNPELMLVDRADLKKLLNELSLNASGMVTPDQAAKIGQLTGAKILVVGSVLMAEKNLILTAKIISTETSRVLGESVKGNAVDQLDKLAEQLAEKIGQTIIQKGGELTPKAAAGKEDVMAGIKKALGDKKRPTVLIQVAERHVGQPASDPAAQTELAWFCKEAGFTVLDAGAPIGQADIVLKGEGFSELAGQRGDMVSVKARLEVKAVDPRTDKVLAVDRQTTVVVDLAEQVAGKTALQEAATAIAGRLLPKLVK